MDEGTIGIIILFSITIFVSVILHVYLIKDLYHTSVISGIVSIVIFLIIAHFIGGPEKFISIAFIVGGAISTVVSFIVGILVRKIKKVIKGEH